MEKMCACGQPLHYSPSGYLRIAVEKVIELEGEFIKVTAPGGSWMVPRHYIALHGLVANELPELAERLGFARADQ